MKLEKKWGMWLLILGGLNWGLVGVGYFMGTNLNVINLILSSAPALESLFYVVVGVCALWVASMQSGKK